MLRKLRINVDSTASNVKPETTAVEVTFTFTKTIGPDKWSDLIKNYHNTIKWERPNKMNVLKETSSNGFVTELRLCDIYRPSLSFNSTTSYRYSGISNMHICCPVSSSWIFEWMTYLPLLQFVRFGVGLFYEAECYEPAVKKLGPLPSVKKLVVEIDKKNFDSKNKFDQTLIKHKMNVLLNLAATHLTGLVEVDFLVPFGWDLDSFWEKSPELKRKRIELKTHEQQMVRFTSTNLDSTSERESDSPNDQVANKKVKLELPPEVDLTDE